ncbi:MAG: alternative ribosome rescue aminoacyl-tRNA hydrolase ArfB [Alphaproteobacteria bacterium]|jgi:ribosome-associated protein|nr:alternative ribosome rescue aminoacyl-tRNA hydrolase ArfB [Alphaproteobacteria bacterium]MDP6238953.1 alternative ribosome rescue aminoacyl-tRNA hydrolase ArfB [Alphaproteobacteria bacterium]MDP7233670.1 alternative ribosome rescue aminoacyl-tRNA hydrolase ArfB [Alphaproteobacteria bacterium]|tara:strand:+ start:14419 stop:14853 length:435 start_codon:yes stop_codon:yes gene_type:complete
MSEPIVVTEHISLDENELVWRFVRASGPGGQKVNKTSSAVQLRFDAAGSLSLSEAVSERLLVLAGRRADASGVLTIDARRFRTQARNRRDALDRLVALVREAADPPKPRRRRGVPVGARKRRLEIKRRRSVLKSLRARVQRESQ